MAIIAVQKPASKMPITASQLERNTAEEKGEIVRGTIFLKFINFFIIGLKIMNKLKKVSGEIGDLISDTRKLIKKS